MVNISGGVAARRAIEGFSSRDPKQILIFDRFVLLECKHATRVLDNTCTLLDWIEGVESQT